MIRKALIPSAGLGTRLFPATKEQPKEMLPVFSRSSRGHITVKPLLQMVFEQLYDAGFREFCFVVGRGKRSIEDHFTSDHNSIGMLKERGKADQAVDLESFYGKLNASTIVWINQPRPKGFGDAVLLAKPFVKDENCLVHAGDTYIVSKKETHFKSVVKVHRQFKADAVFLVQEIENPRQYGVVDAEEIEKGIYRVKEAVEKPAKPKSNLAIMPIYIFHPKIFKALKNTKPGKGGELQLTDAIQKLVDWNSKVYAVRLRSDQFKLDIGTPQMYWQALSLSYRHFLGENIEA